MTEAPPHAEEVVKIPHDGRTVFGILHKPVGPDLGVCIVMMNAGMQSRVGPGRLYLRVARLFALEGLHVLRIDLSGTGDSEGDNLATHFDCHDPGEVGAAVRYVRERLRPKAIVLQGLCAGARVAMKATQSQDVSGVLAWSVPIFSASLTMPQSPHEPADRISGAVARADVSRLLRFILTFRFLDIRWWRKVFPGGKGLLTEAGQVGRAAVRFLLPKDPKQMENPFLGAAEAYLAGGRKVQFLYGDLDQLSFQEFLDRFPDVPEDELAYQGYAVVAKGTHTFSSHAAQAEAVERSVAWLRTHFVDSDRSTLTQPSAKTG